MNAGPGSFGAVKQPAVSTGSPHAATSLGSRAALFPWNPVFGNPAVALDKSSVTQLWTLGQITPFNYLLRGDLGLVKRGGATHERWQDKPTLKGDAPASGSSSWITWSFLSRSVQAIPTRPRVE
jgi:hypothetical protein